ncbi:hypothetical protein LCGC14_0700140 [marine sediment metagenome]|uniref:Uncharacterized protein n=1 Tax=marine sediment metagenome TaxID=412755 RepID=A0A0F9R3C7_9ZZZZ
MKKDSTLNSEMIARLGDILALIEKDFKITRLNIRKDKIEINFELRGVGKNGKM